jgi:hypothetical protein
MVKHGISLGAGESCRRVQVVKRFRSTLVAAARYTTTGMGGNTLEGRWIDQSIEAHVHRRNDCTTTPPITI